MPIDPADVVCELWRHWRARDKAATLDMVSDDIELVQNVPEDVLPFGGVTRGKAAASDRLQMILDQFWTLKFEGEVVSVEGGIVHGLVQFHFRHKATGEDIQGTMRHRFDVRDGRIVRLAETVDVDLVRAFMRLVAQAAARQ